jgi:hypothetical protein
VLLNFEREIIKVIESLGTKLKLFFLIVIYFIIILFFLKKEVEREDIPEKERQKIWRSSNCSAERCA